MKLGLIVPFLVIIATACTTGEQVRPCCTRNEQTCINAYFHDDQKLAFCNGRGWKNCELSDWVKLCEQDKATCQSH